MAEVFLKIYKNKHHHSLKILNFLNLMVKEKEYTYIEKGRKKNEQKQVRLILNEK